MLAENISERGIVSYLRITGHLGTCRTGSLEKEIRLLESILVEKENAFFFI